MQTWKCEYAGNHRRVNGTWTSSHAINFAAKAFADAVKKAYAIAKRRGDLAPRISSLVQTAKLDG